MPVAALGGMLVSLSLFLTVSFHSSPYFTGSGHRLLLRMDTAPPGRRRRCTRPRHLAGRTNDRRPTERPGALPRRDVLSRGAVTGLVAGAAVVLAGLVAAIGRAAAGSTNPALSPGAPTLTTGGSDLHDGRQLGLGVRIPDHDRGPTFGHRGRSRLERAGRGLGELHRPAVGRPVDRHPAVRPGSFTAFDAVCPHAGLHRRYVRSAKIIACPCHGSEFDPSTGDVLRGPAPTGLTPIKSSKDPNGNLYAQ